MKATVVIPCRHCGAMPYFGGTFEKQTLGCRAEGCPVQPGVSAIEGYDAELTALWSMLQQSPHIEAFRAAQRFDADRIIKIRDALLGLHDKPAEAPRSSVPNAKGIDERHCQQSPASTDLPAEEIADQAVLTLANDVVSLLDGMPIIHAEQVLRRADLLIRQTHRIDGESCGRQVSRTLGA